MLELAEEAFDEMAEAAEDSAERGDVPRPGIGLTSTQAPWLAAPWRTINLIRDDPDDAGAPFEVHGTVL